MEKKLVTEKKVMHLKPGDVIYNTITKEQVFDEISEILRPDGLDDTTLKMKDGDEVFCDELDTFLCLVSTKEAKDAEDWLKEKGLFDQTDRLKHIPMLNELSDLLTEFRQQGVLKGFHII